MNLDDDFDLPAQEDDIAVTTGVSFKNLVDGGTEFTINEMSDKEKGDLKKENEDLSQGWWSKEDLLRNLETDYMKVAPVPEDDSDMGIFERKKLQMDVILEFEGKPLVWKKKVRRGAGEKVQSNCAVSYHLNAFLEYAEEPFDSTFIRGKPFLNRLTTDLVVEGLYVALTSMRVGEMAEFIVDPQVGFGEMGHPPRIPANSEIHYIIHILKIMTEGTIGDFLTLPDEEKNKQSFDSIFQMADDERKSGNSYYAAGMIKDSGIRYKRALGVIEHRTVKSNEEEARKNEILLKLYCNVANTSCSLHRPYAAMNYCKRALLINPNHIKALYFCGKAAMNAGDYEQSKKHLKKANNLESDNPDIVALLIKLDTLIESDVAASRELEKKMMASFLGKGPNQV